MEEMLCELKRWQEIGNRKDYDCIREILAPKMKMEEEFIAILESKLQNTESA